MNTMHASFDRNGRRTFIELYIGYGNVVKEVYKGEKERHVVTDTGIIRIYKDDKLITDLIARPGQLKRYFAEVPHKLLEKAIRHQKQGYNYL